LSNPDLVTLIHDKLKLHILVNWDGYSNNGVRADGVFPMQPAPIQVSHLVYVGTIGGKFTQYVVTDAVTSPLNYSQYYSKKFLYLPQSFFVNSHMHFRRIAKPEYFNESSLNPGQADREFRFCNFNKHLKFSPQIFDVWMRILTTLRKQGIRAKFLM